MDIVALLSDPAAWAALITLIVMEVVLGIDNLIFISILSNKLPEHQRQRARRQFVGQDRNEDQIVDPQHHLHHDQGDKGRPGGGVAQQRDDVHQSLH